MYAAAAADTAPAAAGSPAATGAPSAWRCQQCLHPSRVHPRTAPRGLSLIELLVGVAIGLLIVAAGISAFGAGVREQQSLALESRLMQDLRSAADVATRALRRPGYWASAPAGIWVDAATPVLANPYAAVAVGAAASDAITFSYSHNAVENNAVDSNEQFGFQLRRGVLEMQLGGGNWQALSDSASWTVTNFSITPTLQQVDLQGSCAASCPAGSSTCPPRVAVRAVELAISGRAIADPAVVRSVSSSVRLRNDLVSGACPA